MKSTGRPADISVLFSSYVLKTWRPQSHDPDVWTVEQLRFYAPIIYIIIIIIIIIINNYNTTCGNISISFVSFENMHILTTSGD
jgi:hypothetical protein